MKSVLRKLLIVVGILLVIAAVAVSSFPHYFISFFEIKKVELVGETDHISPMHFKRSLGNTVEGNFFDIDLEAIRMAALGAPWVKEVSVHKVWPNRIRIRIKEHRALALWEDGRLVSVEGVLFAANPEEAENSTDLPEFFGPADRVRDVTRRYKRFSQMLKTVIPEAKVTELSVSDRDSWTLAIASKKIPPTRIELGTEQSDWTLEDRFGVVIVQYPEVVALMKGAPSSIDARYENAFSATLPENTLKRLPSKDNRRREAEAVAERYRQ